MLVVLHVLCSGLKATLGCCCGVAEPVCAWRFVKFVVRLAECATSAKCAVSFLLIASARFVAFTMHRHGQCVLPALLHARTVLHVHVLLLVAFQCMCAHSPAAKKLYKQASQAVQRSIS